MMYTVAPAGQPSPRLSAPVPDETLSHASFRQVDSECIFYFQRGAGPPLILLHGMFGDFLDWEPVLEPLSRAFRVIAPDLPGFGQSSKPRRGYTADFFLAILREFLCQLGIERAAWMGNSFGGQLAILRTLREPETVDRLVLVASGGFRCYTEEEKKAIEERFSEAALAALTPGIQSILFSPLFVGNPRAAARYLERQNAKLARADFPAYAGALASAIRLALSTCLLDRLEEIPCPTLLVAGEADPVVPVEAVRQARQRLRRGQIEILPGCAHAPQLECPGEFVQAVLPFLSDPHPPR